MIVTNTTRRTLTALFVTALVLSGCDCGGDAARVIVIEVDANEDDVIIQTDANPLLNPDVAEDATEDTLADALDDADAEPDLPVEVSSCCASDEACDEGMVCLGGGCVSPAASPYEVTGALTYVAAMKIPGEACCFDVNGNGHTDNRLGAVFASLGDLGDVGDVQAEIDSSVEVGEIGMLVEIEGLDEQLTGDDLHVKFIFGSTDGDGDRHPDQDYDTRAAGGGIFTLLANSLGEFGPTFQFGCAEAEAGTLSSDAATMVATTLVPNLTEDRPIEIPLYGLQIAAQLERNEEGQLQTAGEAGELHLGGAVSLEFFADVLNDAAAGCAAECGVEPDSALFGFTEGADRVQLSCTTDLPTPYPCADDRSSVCANLPRLCDQAPVIAMLADVDTNDNGVKDALSFGVSLTLVPATLSTELPIAPPDEICGNGIDDDRDFRIECWDDECDDTEACQ